MKLYALLALAIIAGCSDASVQPAPSTSDPDPTRPDIPTSAASNQMWIHIRIDEVPGTRYAIQLRIDSNQVEHRTIYTGGSYDTLVADGYHTVRAWAWDTTSSGGSPKKHWAQQFTGARDTTLRLQF